MAVEKWIPIKEEAPAVDERLAAFSSPCESKEPYVLMVLGDSMAPEFNEGDVIVIEPHNRVGDGSYVIAWHKEEYTFRKLRIVGDSYFLEAENPAYPAERIDGIDQIKGVITQKKGKGRHNRKNYT
jgi:DNA polymerase V